MISLEETYFALAALLLLSIATVGLCKADGIKPRSYSEFLFTGKTFFHSIVSSAGAVFSVTYLLGATIIYATIYRAWTFAMAVLVVSISTAMISRIIRLASVELPEDRVAARDRNLLISFMEKRLDAASFQTFIRLLSLAFLLLLVEELAIARLVLNSLIPDVALASSILLFAIVCVVYFYLSIGGFRALLNSDLVQGVVLVAFLLVLLFFVSDTEGAVIHLATAPTVGGSEILWATIFWSIYGICFFMSAVDLFARLNFETPKGRFVQTRQVFVAITMLLLLLIVSVGILFGLALSPDIGGFQSASHYYSTIVQFFTSSDAVQVKVVFLVTLFCMIFTTVDTLLLAVMQIRFYQRGVGARRTDMSTVLVLAVALSVIVEVDAVCAFGIFVGSLLILPCTQILCEIMPSVPLKLGRQRYLWLALAIATTSFLSFYEALEMNFSHQYLIPAIVVASVLVSAVSWDLLERIVRR